MTCYMRNVTMRYSSITLWLHGNTANSINAFLTQNNGLLSWCHCWLWHYITGYTFAIFAHILISLILNAEIQTRPVWPQKRIVCKLLGLFMAYFFSCVKGMFHNMCPLKCDMYTSYFSNLLLIYRYSQSSQKHRKQFKFNKFYV